MATSMWISLPDDSCMWLTGSHSPLGKSFSAHPRLWALWVRAAVSSILLWEVICFSVVSDSLWLHGLHSPWNSPGQNAAVGSLSLLQGIFPTQGLNPGLPHCRWILYQLSHQGSPRILEWVAQPFSRGSSWSRNWIRVSRIAGRFFTSWGTQEAQW